MRVSLSRVSKRDSEGGGKIGSEQKAEETSEQGCMSKESLASRSNGNWEDQQIADGKKRNGSHQRERR